MENKFSTLRLSKGTVSDLSDLKRSFEFCYDRRISYDEFVRTLMENVEKTEPVVWEAYIKLRSIAEESRKKKLEEES